MVGFLLPCASSNISFNMFVFSQVSSVAFESCHAIFWEKMITTRSKELEIQEQNPWGFAAHPPVAIKSLVVVLLVNDNLFFFMFQNVETHMYYSHTWKTTTTHSRNLNMSFSQLGFHPKDVTKKKPTLPNSHPLARPNLDPKTAWNPAKMGRELGCQWHIHTGKFDKCLTPLPLVI